MAGETSAYYSLMSSNSPAQTDDSSTSRLLPEVIRKPVPNSDYHRIEVEQHGLSSQNAESRPTTPATLLQNESAPPPEKTPDTPKSSATLFRRNRQLVRLILSGSIRFIFTVALILGLYGTFKIYQNHGIMGEDGKTVYNTLVTGLSMTLGINIASSFKAIALDVRWYIISRKKRSIEEVCVSDSKKTCAVAMLVFFERFKFASTSLLTRMQLIDNRLMRYWLVVVLRRQVYWLLDLCRG